MASAEAQRLLDLLSASPENWEIRAQAADQLFSEGRIGEATALIDAAPAPPEAEPHVLKAAEIYNASQPAKAIPLIHGYLQKNPDSALAHLAMAESAGILGDLRSATQYYQCAVELNRAYRDPDFEEKYGITLENAPTPLTAKTETVPIHAMMEEEAPAHKSTAPVAGSRKRPASSGSKAGGCLVTILVALGVFGLSWLVLLLVLQSMVSGS